MSYSQQELDRIIVALEKPSYDWRTVGGVAKETRLSKETVLEVISHNADLIVKSEIPDVRGQDLYTTREHRKKRLDIGSASNLAVGKAATIVSGHRNLLVKDGKVVGRDVPIEDQTAVVLPVDRAFERLEAASKQASEELGRSMQKARRESSHYHTATLVCALVGFLVIIAAVILLILEQTTTAIVTAVSSAVCEAAAKLANNKDKELREEIQSLNKLLQEHETRLTDQQNRLTAMDFAGVIEDADRRDEARLEVVRSLLSPAEGLSSAA